jgi:uncharacterized protein (DUF362 family)
LAVGKDPIAVDIICAKLMGFSMEAIPHLAGAAWAGIGQSKRIETRGIPPEELQNSMSRLQQFRKFGIHLSW